MDWEKLNFDEIGFYCKSSKSPVEIGCFPSFSMQVEALCNILFFYGIERFYSGDLQHLFQILELKNGRTGKVILPSGAKIKASLEKLSNQGVLPEKESFTLAKNNLIQEDTYSRAIAIAQQKGEVRDWADYARQKGEVCQAFVHPKIAAIMGEEKE